jgi:hypothetical protein
VTWPSAKAVRVWARYSTGAACVHTGTESSGEWSGTRTVKRRPHPNRGPESLGQGRKNGRTGANTSAAGGTTRAGAGFPDTPATQRRAQCPLGFRPPLSLERGDARKVWEWQGPHGAGFPNTPATPFGDARSVPWVAGPACRRYPGSRSCALEHSSNGGLARKYLQGELPTGMTTRSRGWADVPGGTHDQTVG